MIDMHSHVIYDVDDGPKDIEASIDILKSAKLNGIDEMFLTSHYMDDGYKASGEKYLSHFDKLQEAILRNNIDLKVYFGNEVMIYPGLADDLKLGKFMTLNNSKYLLIELPLTEKVLYLEDVLFQVVSKGFIPIIAHPERYVYFQKDLDYFKELLCMGALFQVNGGSVIGVYGRGAEKTATYLLEHHMVHFIGSDAHSPHRIFDSYSQIIWKIKKLIGEEYLYDLTIRNPSNVVIDGEVKNESFIAPKRRRWLW